MKNATRPAIFKWRQTAPELILCAVRWYLRYSLSLRDVEGVVRRARSGGGSHDDLALGSTLRPELEQRLRPQLKPTNKSWRVDETYIRIQGRWCYLYRAIDSTGATIDFLLPALRDAAAARTCSVRRSAIHRIRSPASSTLIRPASTGAGSSAIKRRVKAKQSFREFQAARRTIADTNLYT